MPMKPHVPLPVIVEKDEDGVVTAYLFGTKKEETKTEAKKGAKKTDSKKEGKK